MDLIGCPYNFIQLKHRNYYERNPSALNKFKLTRSIRSHTRSLWSRLPRSPLSAHDRPNDEPLAEQDPRAEQPDGQGASSVSGPLEHDKKVRCAPSLGLFRIHRAEATRDNGVNTPARPQPAVENPTEIGAATASGRSPQVQRRRVLRFKRRLPTESQL